MSEKFVINTDGKNANVARTIRFTEPLFESLAAVAQQNKISFNDLVLQCCKYALNNMEEK
ncbi:MAG: hypothetical protein IKD18_03155 [Clostridia bacterium]|nr:hypothetical protein [Clostridia bacterium]